MRPFRSIWDVQVEQSAGLGIMPFFNKHSVSFTRFLRLDKLGKKQETIEDKYKARTGPFAQAPPPVAVMHARSAC